jgi:hypothetical protein
MSSQRRRRLKYRQTLTNSLHPLLSPVVSAASTCAHGADAYLTCCVCEKIKQLKGCVPITAELEFKQLVSAAHASINSGRQPTLAAEGTRCVRRRHCPHIVLSGTYFVHGPEGPIGVFKPRSEEPFASLNPRWPKFMQKMLSPCCFGRRCLLSNRGYLSEVSARVIQTVQSALFV